jgi:adenosylcobinamide-phosphate synthase
MSTMSQVPHPLAAAAGLVVDQLFDEPATSVHPVAHFGRVMADFEARTYRDDVHHGVTHALVGVSIGVAAGRTVRSTTLATGLAVGGRALWRAAREIAHALETGDLDRARELLPTLVGRDPHDLDESEIARAVVESVAENTVDAIVAPAFWAAVAGAPGALAYRAINTMDAMVGHHSPRYENYGAPSARLDDAANWVPARVTAALVAMVRVKNTSAIRTAVATQAPAHPSPNAGVAEAAFAAALDLELGGVNHYGERTEDRVRLGVGRAVRVSDIHEAIRLSRDVTYALVSLLGLAGLTLWWRR